MSDGNNGGTALAERPQTAIAQRAYNPLAPVGSAPALKKLLEAQKDSIAQMLPKHITPERLFKTLLVAANRTPDLLQCTQSSMLETINRAAELGLDLSGTLGEAYPVPFSNKMKDGTWAKQCQLIIGYRGLAKLARQSGEISHIDADIVCENDDFTMSKGTGGKCEFKPNYRRERGQIVGAFAYVKLKDGGEQYDFMPFDDIEKVRARSKSGSDKQGNAIGAWRSDWSEMAKKTVFRRVAKWLPLSTEKFVSAIEQDDANYELSDVLEAQAGGKSKALAQEMSEATVTVAPAPPFPDTQLPEQEIAERLAPQAAEQEIPDEKDQENPAGGGEERQADLDFSDPAKWRDAVIEVLAGREFAPEQANKAWNAELLKFGAKGKPEKVSMEGRARTFAAAVNGTGAFALPSHPAAKDGE